MLEELETARIALLAECYRVRAEFERARDALTEANEVYNTANTRRQKYDSLLAVTDDFLRFVKAGGQS